MRYIVLIAVLVAAFAFPAVSLAGPPPPPVRVVVPAPRPPVTVYRPPVAAPRSVAPVSAPKAPAPVVRVPVVQKNGVRIPVGSKRITTSPSKTVPTFKGRPVNYTSKPFRMGTTSQPMYYNPVNPIPLHWMFWYAATAGQYEEREVAQESGSEFDWTVVLVGAFIIVLVAGGAIVIIVATK